MVDSGRTVHPVPVENTSPAEQLTCPQLALQAVKGAVTLDLDPLLPEESLSSSVLAQVLAPPSGAPLDLQVEVDHPPASLGCRRARPSRLGNQAGVGTVLPLDYHLSPAPGRFWTRSQVGEVALATTSQKDTGVGDAEMRRKRAGGWIRTVLSTVVLGASAAFLVVGSNRSHQVAGEDAEELAELLGFAPFEWIGDRELVVDTTFTGVVRREEMLISTYDRSKPREKQACPT